MLRAAFVQVANTLQLAQHVGRHIVADALGMTKLQIQHRLAQVGVGTAVCQHIARTAEQFRLLLMLLEPTGHFAVGATVREHPHRGAGGIAVWRGVSMDRDEEIGVLLTRHLRAAHHRNKVIPVAGQHRLKLRIGVQ